MTKDPSVLAERMADATGNTGTPRAEGRNLIVTAAEFLDEKDPVEEDSLLGDGLIVVGGGYGVLGGDGGVGKTVTLAGLFTNLAAARAEFLGFKLPGKPTPVLVWEAEGSRARFRVRMKTLAESYGHDLRELPIFFAARGVRPMLDRERLGRMIEASRAVAVLLDPIGRFHTENENDASGWRKGVVDPLAALSREFGTVFVFPDHYVKPSENRSGDAKVRGSRAKRDDAGLAMRLEYGKAGKASRILFFDRARDADLPDPDRLALRIDLRRAHVELDPGATAEAVEESPRRREKEERAARKREQASADAQEKLERGFKRLEKEKGYDHDRGVSERELADAAEMSRNRGPFKDGLRALEAQGLIEVAPDGWRRVRR